MCKVRVYSDYIIATFELGSQFYLYLIMFEVYYIYNPKSMSSGLRGYGMDP
jgi:hypothetical protein